MVNKPTVWKAQYRLNPAEATDFPQGDLQIISLSGGGFLAAYNALTAIDVRFFDAEGKGVGSVLSAPMFPPFPDAFAMANRPDGSYVILPHEDEGVGTGDTRIVAHILDADFNFITGGPVVEPDEEAPESLDDVSPPSIAVQSDGTVAFTYIRENLDGGEGSFDVMARTLSPGNVPGAEVTIYDSLDKTGGSAEIIARSSGGFAIVREHFYSVTDTDVVITFVDAGLGNPVDVTVNNRLDDQVDDVQIAELANGGFVVAWVTDDGKGSGIQYQVLTSNGGVISGDSFNFHIANATKGGDQVSPDVAALKDGGFIIAWRDINREVIYAQRFDANGDTVGGQFEAGKNPTGVELDPVVTTLEDGRFIIGFDGATPFDVFGTIFDPRGETINGTSGKDVLTSRKDGATVKGKNGNDTLLGQNDDDTLEGGNGKDHLVGRKGSDTLSGGKGTDFLDGGKGNDILRGGPDSDALNGGENNDRLFGDDGEDMIRGEAGKDTLDGGKGKDGLWGGGGDDTLNGGKHVDFLIGEGGNDRLTGGSGNDIFAFTGKFSATKNVDTVTDFEVNKDLMFLDLAYFKGMGSKLNAKEFHIGTKAKDGNDRIIYDENSGKLFYDHNGNKSGGQKLFAKLDKNLNLDHNDFALIA